MAKKKQNVTEQDAVMMQQHDEQFQQQMNDLQQIDALEQQTKMIQQEGLNKSHDVELSPYSDVNGQNAAMENLNVIGEKEIEKAYETLLKYKEAKATLENRIIENEKYWKMQHWEMMHDYSENETQKRIEPKSANLVNMILNKHADAMDSYPEPNILPRSKDDEETAEVLSQIIPVILDQNDYQGTYSDCQWYKQKHGGCVQGVLWNNDRDNGLGNIEIKKIDVLKLYWKPSVSDIQDSPNVFHVTMMDNDEIKERYPDLKDVNGTYPISDNDTYNYGETIDSENRSAVIDWYYKKRVQTVDSMNIPKTKTVLHYCQFCNGQVIYASENDPNYAERGWYDHGKYPFVFDVLFPVEGSVWGMGYIDIEGDEQLQIDKLGQCIMENASALSRPRYAVRVDSGLNEEEFADLSKDIVHFEGNLGEDAFRQIVASPLSGIYESIYLNKIQEMKDTSGNTAASQGAASNVTAASGIASLQEAAGKLSRDSSSSSYRSFKKVIDLVIELIRQFYTEPRCFRITGDTGHNEFITFDNSGLQPQSQGQAFGVSLGDRLPIMDIDVRPQKKSAYSKESQNQTAINLYNMGFFAPNNADASLSCLEMMEFDGVEKVRERVSQNGLMYQQLMQMQQLIMQLSGNSMEPAAMEPTGSVAKQGGASVDNNKGSLTTQAATATRNSTAPR